MARRFATRPIDSLGLESAMADRLLPFLVAAMSFLAALAFAGSLAASNFATHWQDSARSTLTIEVPDPTLPAGTPPAANPPAAAPALSRQAAVLAALQRQSGVDHVKQLGPADLQSLLAPWLGHDAADLPISLPAVMTATAPHPIDLAALQTTLTGLAPGAMVDSGATWAARLGDLTGSLQASAAAILIVVALVAGAVVAVAVRAGLAQRRDSIEIIHGLGALDADIANRFASRALRLAFLGGAAGALLALPLLLWLAHLSAPFAAAVPLAAHPASGKLQELGQIRDSLPAILWGAPALLAGMAALIGWIAAQITVRGWLRRLI